MSSEKFNYKPHPKQLEFINDDRPRVLYGGGYPHRADSSWIKKLFMEDRFVWIDNNRYVIDLELWKKAMFTYVVISHHEFDNHSNSFSYIANTLAESYRALVHQSPRKNENIVILYESNFLELMMANEVQFNAPPINLHTSIETALQDYYHQIPEGKKGGVFGVVTKDSDGRLLTNAVIAVKAGDTLEVGGYIGKKWGGDLVYGFDAKFFF